MAVLLRLPSCFLVLFLTQTVGSVLETSPVSEDAVADVRRHPDVTSSLCREARSDDVSACDVMLQQHSQAISALQATLTAQQAELTALKAKTDKLSNVVVYAALAVESPNAQRGDTVIFSRVISDVGHAYDVTTGVFLVPVTGLYSVYVRADPYETNFLTLTLVVDNIGKVDVYGERAPGGVGLHLSLKRGGRVWVTYENGHGVQGASLLSVALIVPQ